MFVVRVFEMFLLALHSLKAALHLTVKNQKKKNSAFIVLMEKCTSLLGYKYRHVKSLNCISLKINASFKALVSLLADG